MDDRTLDRISIRRDMKSAGEDPDTKVTVAALTLFGKAVGEEMAKLLQRISALEKQLSGVQKKADHLDSHALTFRGDWQAAEHYYASNVVRYKGCIFAALKDIAPGKAEPGRQGAGWELIV